MEEIQDTQGALWEVFIQSKKGLPFKHVGSVHAFDKEMAVQNARDLYTRRGEGKGMWLFQQVLLLLLIHQMIKVF